MNTNDFLKVLRALNVKLWVEEERLRYSAPPGALKPDLLAELASRKAEITAFLRQAEAPTSRPQILPGPRSGHVPLSVEQERLWFLEQLNGPSPTYNVAAGWRLRGPLNPGVLIESFQEIVRRHESLRTTFVEFEGKPRQIIAAQLTLEVPIIAVRETDISALFEEFSQEPFDLIRGPLIRTKLLRLSGDDHVWFLSAHHLVTDAWSITIVMREFSALYEAKLQGAPPALADLSIQYADYAIWQRERQQEETLQEQAAYWQKQLAGLPPLLELPTDHQRPVVQSHRGAKIPFSLPAALSQALVQLTRDEQGTLFTTLVTAFTVLLGRYTGQTDIAVGFPMGNRRHSVLEHLIGFFVNTLVLRTDLSGNPSWKELIREVRDTTLNAQANQGLSFEQVVELLSPERSLSYSPLFQIEFIVQNSLAGEFTLRDIELTPLMQEKTSTKFDLTLAMFQSKHGLYGHIVYSTDLFERDTILRMIEHYQNLLEAMVANREQKVLEAPILAASEQRRMIAEWNDTAAPVPAEACVHELFEEQVEKTPGATAIVFRDQKLTYRELNSRANQFARRLIALGAGPEVAIGLCVERSLESFICLLGILKAGAAYLPLDPTYPEERLKLVIEDSQVPITVTSTQSSKAMLAGSRQIRVDEEQLEIASPVDQNPVTSVLPLNLCYVIYTSGSTGKPKGFAMPHAALVNLISWYKTKYPLHETSRTLQFASINFDVSFEEMFTTWSLGGTLIVPDDEQRRNPYQLLDFLVRHSVNRMFIPVVMLQQLAQAFCETNATAPLLKQVIPSGSQLQITDEIRRFFAAMPGAELHNNYGPSETHTITRYALPATIEDWKPLPAIGFPFSNTTIHLLDEKNQLVPIGAQGELCIGGAQLARGYRDQPALTAEKFVPDPFSTMPGGRLYRSGDLARRRKDGCLEWLSRKDHQVKIRGYRIELGEIEATLRQHPSVNEVVVIVREDQLQNKQLVAYVQAEETDGDLSSELYGFLKLKLPDYEIPAAFVVLSAIPLNANGKIDRAALPAPDFSQAGGEDYVEPRTETEKVLGGIWSELLELERVGVFDNFFQLGGHSLIATQVISRVRTAFKLELPIMAIFEAPTVAGLAEKIQDLMLENAFIQAGQDSALSDAGVEEDELVL